MVVRLLAQRGRMRLPHRCIGSQIPIHTGYAGQFRPKAWIHSHAANLQNDDEVCEAKREVSNVYGICFISILAAATPEQTEAELGEDRRWTSTGQNGPAETRGSIVSDQITHTLRTQSIRKHKLVWECGGVLAFISPMDKEVPCFAQVYIRPRRRARKNRDGYFGKA